MEKDLKILVVDDTVTDRQILSRIIAGFENAELIGTAPNGKIALSKINLVQPDLVILDVVMPEMNGVETLTQIKKKYPSIDVIMLSSLDQEHASLTMSALSAGALDFITKPSGKSLENNITELTATLSRLISMARTRKYSRQARNISENKIYLASSPTLYAPISKQPLSPAAHQISRVKSPPTPSLCPHHSSLQKEPIDKRELIEKIVKKTNRIDAVAIGVSTGGPNALQEIIPKLNADFPAPILSVQHMPAMFTASLASRLNSLSSIRVVEAKDEMTVEKGVMYIAPGGRHMVVRKKNLNLTVIALVDSPPVNSCRPSVDVLFRSIAMTYGGNVLTVILTGMGNDGVSGVGAIYRKGGYSIVQDEKSSVIWGMPGAVVGAGEADEIVSIEQMAYKIMRIVKEGHL